MKIAIGSDHGGFELKEDLKTYLKQAFSDHEVIDCGTYDTTSTDYTKYGVEVAQAVLSGKADRGIVLCGTGIGITMTVGRIKGIRAALCHDAFTARMSRLHNNTNILAIGGRTTGKEVARDMVKIWLETEFEGGRHQRRITQIDTLTSSLFRTDPEIAETIIQEYKRQQTKLELSASENFVSDAVREALGCVMTNKYTEGYPGKRDYGGCEFVDVAETLAIERAKQLFSADYANVQPHSGTLANIAVYSAMLEPGDTILGMSLSYDGHFLRESPVNFPGKYFHIVSYGVAKTTERIDFDQVRELAKQYKPKLIVTGTSAYPRTIDFSRFREIADEVGAYMLSDIGHIAGLVAVGLHPSPVPYSEVVTATTHKTLRGPRGGLILCQQKLVDAIQKNVFPGIQDGPMMHTVAAKAVAFQEALQPSFREYQQQVLNNAQALSEALERFGFRLVTGGTENHLLLVDLTSQDLTGKVAEKVLDNAGITVTKNLIPFDRESPSVTSGIRLGTPALTTRGMKEDEMKKVAAWISRVLNDAENLRLQQQIVEEVREFCSSFPLHTFR